MTSPPQDRGGGRRLGVRRAVLALGSNLGDRLAMLQGAVDALADTPGVTVVAVSPVYETDPVGGPDQPEFLNAVVLVESDLAPRTLLERAHAVEAGFGRVRAEHWGARTLDVDLVAVGDLTVTDDDLQVPHARARERAFVLAPWRDVDPEAVLPGAGRVADLARVVGSDGVRRRDDLRLDLP
ncbi:MAG: 2-amino-4-hydroxy-6-hydroxymethyldihydropteridine diphosphokinase [Actinomycetes bacterium]